MFQIRKFAKAILQGKQGLLCDKNDYLIIDPENPFYQINDINHDIYWPSDMKKLPKAKHFDHSMQADLDRCFLQKQ